MKLIPLKRKKIVYSIFFLLHIIIPFFISCFYSNKFNLNRTVIIAHLFVTGLLYLIFLTLGLLFLSIDILKYNKFKKYIVSFLYVCFIIMLSGSYLLAFYGKIFTSRIITYQMFFAYFGSTEYYLKEFSIAPVMAYVVILILLGVITYIVYYIANFINSAFFHLKKFILLHNFNNPPRLIKFNIFIVLLIVGFTSGVIVSRGIKNVREIILFLQEPILSTYISQPFQRQYLKNDNLESEIRKSYPKNIKFKKKNVIIIVVDALRADHLSLFGYKRKTSPFLDSLYSSTNLKKIDLSLSPAGASFAGINGILRSKVWANIGFNDFSIQQLLKDQGYKINFILSGDHTNFYDLKSFYGIGSDIDYYIDGTQTKKYSASDDRIVFEGLSTIKKYTNVPNFFQFHLNSVHQMGVRLNKYKVFKPDKISDKNIRNYVNRYDNGVIQADDNIKSIFSILAKKGYLKNSIVVVTADHGEALGEHGQLGHTKNVYTDHILIPLLIYNSGITKYKNATFATSLDIAPTIVNILGLPIPKNWEGRSLISEDVKEFTYHQMGDFYAVVQNKDKKLYKFIYNSKTKIEEVYELNSDLYEKNNLIDSISKKQLALFREHLKIFRIEI